MAQRGDVVIVDFPFSDQPTKKRRPAIIVQAQVYNQVMAKSIIAMVTGNLLCRGDPAHLFIDPATSDGALSGLRASSLVSCINLFTIEQKDIIKKLGCLPAKLEMELTQNGSLFENGSPSEGRFQNFAFTKHANQM
jgi:mRNA interferase MazF